MIKEEHLSLNKTARKEELLAYVICKDYIFGNKKCLVGDSVKANCPDIYCEDFSIGAEVVICENADTFNKIQRLKTGNAFDRNKVRKNKKSLYEYLSKQPNINKDYQKYIVEEEEYFYKLENLVTEKLLNQKNKQYKACKEMNLIVMSCFKDKTFVDDEEIFEYCKILMQLHNNPYKAVYIVLSDRTLMIDNNYNKKILSDLRINKEELEK